MDKTEIELNEIKRWIELTYSFTCNYALLLSDSFSQQPNRRALKERALRATEAALREIRQLSPFTADNGYRRLSALADRLSKVSSDLFSVQEKHTDCSQSCSSQDFQPPDFMEV
jgi:hypothetical protein